MLKKENEKKIEKNGKKIIKKNQIDFFIILIEWISVSIARRMFPSAFSPIHDMKGDDTVNIVSTPYFPASPLPLPTSEPSEPAVSKVSRRLFENSSVSYLSEWTTDSSSNEWTTDSEADSEEEPENEFRWSATPNFKI